MKLNNLKALESFREIMAAGSVTGAAQVLGMSQPAVSRLLAQLEGDLGFRVFDRVKGRLVPTAHALVLYEEVDMAFHGLERVRALAQDIVSINAGHLRVVAPPTFAEGPLVPVIASFMRAHPKIQVAMASRTGSPSGTTAGSAAQHRNHLCIAAPASATRAQDHTPGRSGR